MKTAIVICLAVILAFGCGLVIYGGIADATIDEVTIASTELTGEIGSFSATTPVNDAVLTAIPAFKWEKAENAETYTLEIASTTEFDISTDEYYIITSGIVSNEFNLQADLKKDKRYYWRVTAKNKDHQEVIAGDYLTFYYQAILYDEIPISIGYADEWKVHEVGSKATVSLDHNGFFADKTDAADMAAKKDSLRISFDSEDTQRGPQYVESNGWVVVTRSLESEFYGPDAFCFNFYYSGNDATAYFRLIDEDNEYWYAPIKIAVNAKQTIIMRLSDFTLRTKGTPVVNETFDYHYLKSMELVFERVDGDGVAYFGNLKAVKYEDYQDMVIDSLDFSREGYTYVDDSVYFEFNKTISASGDSFTYEFTPRTGVPDAQKGYGFVKMNVGKILSTSDAFAFNVDLSGVADKNFNFLLRVIEEDNDVWTFKILAKDIPADGNLLVPFSAFMLADGGFKGDGIRQFYYVKQFQFGLNNKYSAGAITVGDFKIVRLSDKVENLYKTTVGTDGMIDDFEGYESIVDIYYKWEPTTANKDEAINLYNEPVLDKDNPANIAAKFFYKTDLSDAGYHITFDSVEGYSAIELYAKDSSAGNFNATMTVYLIGGPNELYTYEIKNLAKEWIRYTIPISAFNITEDSFGSQHITCENVTGIALAFKHSFTVPTYTSGSYVCVDSIRFSTATEYEAKEVTSRIKMSGNKAVINTFDTDDEFVVWGKKLDTTMAASEIASNTAATISETETASGEGRSLGLTYKTQMVAPYCAYVVVDSGVTAKGITLLLKGDTRPSTYVEVIVYVNNKAYKARIDVETGWHYYSIGFSEFKYNNTTESVSASDVVTISQVALYIKNYTGEYIPGTLYLDEIYFDNTITTTTKTVTAYSA